MNSIATDLSAGLQQQGLTLSSEKFVAYLQLLHQWNQAYNLTAVRDPHEMVARHILDSLAILPWVKGPRIIDVGTGAGLPGVPIAIACPQFHVALLDSNGKKARFLNEVKRILSLTNIEIVQSRAENYRPQAGFDTVTSRALTDIAQMIAWTQHLIKTDGSWLAMKGRFPEMELSRLHRPYQVETYTVPGITSERCCVIVKNGKKE